VGGVRNVIAWEAITLVLVGIHAILIHVGMVPFAIIMVTTTRAGILTLALHLRVVGVSLAPIWAPTTCVILRRTRARHLRVVGVSLALVLVHLITVMDYRECKKWLTALPENNFTTGERIFAISFRVQDHFFHRIL